MYVISSWADQSSEECPSGCKDCNIDKRAEWPHLLLCNNLQKEDRHNSMFNGTNCQNENGPPFFQHGVGTSFEDWQLYYQGKPASCCCINNNSSNNSNMNSSIKFATKAVFPLQKRDHSWIQAHIFVQLLKHIWYAGIEWHQSKWKIFNASKNVTKSLNFCVGWKIIPKREKLTGLFYSMRSTWLMPFIFRWRILQVILGQPDALLHVSLDFMPEKRFFQLVFISWMMRWASEARNGGPAAQFTRQLKDVYGLLITFYAFPRFWWTKDWARESKDETDQLSMFLGAGIKQQSNTFDTIEKESTSLMYVSVTRRHMLLFHKCQSYAVRGNTNQISLRGGRRVLVSQQQHTQPSSS